MAKPEEHAKEGGVLNQQPLIGDDKWHEEIDINAITKEIESIKKIAESVCNNHYIWLFVSDVWLYKLNTIAVCACSYNVCYAEN